jgi:VanZ family protein
MMVLIFWLSAQPSLPAPPGPLTDKQLHGLFFGALCGLWYRALARGTWPRVTLGRGVMAMTGTILYGAIDETHQWSVPGRSAEVADLLADAVGAACAAAIIWVCGIIAARRPLRRAETTR